MSKKKPGRRLRLVLLIAAVCVTLYFLLGGTRGLMGFFRLRHDVTELELQLRGARSTVDSLEREISRLRSDTAYIERVAREKLGMARRDEKVYKFIEEK
jgi:cell division protein FtsB